MGDREDFQAGVGKRAISPAQPKLLRPSGMMRYEPTIGNLETNYVVVVAVQTGGEVAFVVTSDMLEIKYTWLVAIRNAVAEKTGVDYQRILMSAAHNHSSLPLPGELLSDVDKKLKMQALEEAEKIIVDGYVGACVDAYNALRPAEIAASTISLEKSIGENRRMRLSTGGGMTSWAAGPVIPPGTRIAGPGGADSHDIDIICLREPGSKTPFALLTSYASHIHFHFMPYFSGEFAGAAKRELESRLPGVIALYANHACGDIDIHCSYPMPEGSEEDRIQWYQEKSAVLAKQFADAVMSAIPSKGYTRPASLKHEFYAEEDHMRPEKHVDLVNLNAIMLDDIAIVSIPGEMCIEYGLRMRQKSKQKHVFLMSYNGSTNNYYHVPVPKQEEGSYEARIGKTIRPEAGDEITKQVLVMLDKLAG